MVEVEVYARVADTAEDAPRFVVFCVADSNRYVASGDVTVTVTQILILLLCAWNTGMQMAVEETEAAQAPKLQGCSWSGCCGIGVVAYVGPTKLRSFDNTIIVEL